MTVINRGQCIDMNLPVRQMILYKHGVGFFVRQGKIEGTEATLSFRKDDINDVLKSLTVFDLGGGQVLGLHYQTPKDREVRLEIYSQQEQIRANLGALQPTGKEAQLRDRLLNDLEATQDRLDAIAAEIADAGQTIAETEAKIEALIAALNES